MVSDTHVPERADSVPPEMLDLIERLSPFDAVVHAGDLVSESVLEWVRGLAPRAYVVRGNMDYLELPEREVVELGPGLRLGVVHGHQVRPRGNVEALTALARRLGVSVLVSGHTHYPFVRESGGVLHVNPGSLTGVWGGGGGSMRPSLAVIEVGGDGVRVEVYELVAGRPRRTVEAGPWTPR